MQPLCEAHTFAGYVAPAAVTDHIIAVSAGGAKLDPANFMCLCHECHNRKSAMEKVNRFTFAGRVPTDSERLEVLQILAERIG